MGLLEAMDNSSLHYYDNYGFNITSFSTFLSLALAIFGNGHRENEDAIKVIKGHQKNLSDKLISDVIVIFSLIILIELLKKGTIMI